MSVSFMIGMIIGLSVGLVFSLFKLVVMLACEISKYTAHVIGTEIEKAVEAQSVFKIKEA